MIWKIKFKDFTPDNNSLVVYFIGSGQKDYFYRLDIPMNQMTFHETHNHLTVWPIILLNLKAVFIERGYKKMCDMKNNDVVGQPKNLKLNFISGLNLKALDKLKAVDIDSIVESKNILQFL